MEQKVLDTLCQHRFLWQKMPECLFFLPCESSERHCSRSQWMSWVWLSGLFVRAGDTNWEILYFFLFERRPPSSLLPTVMGFSLFSQYWGLILCHWLTAPYPPSVYSLPPFCLHRSSVLPEDQGTWRAAAPEGGGPVEGWQVWRVNWAGALHA